MASESYGPGNWRRRIRAAGGRGAAVLALLGLAGCGAEPVAPDALSGLRPYERITLAHDGPDGGDASLGGYYAAVLHGFFLQEGLDVTLVQPTRPGASALALAAAGEADYGVADADRILVARARGLDVVGLMAPVQTGFLGLAVRADSPVHTLGDLGDATVHVPAGWPAADLLPSLLSLQTPARPWEDGDPADLLARPGHLLAGWAHRRPARVADLDLETRFLPLAEAGFDPYARVLAADAGRVRARPDEVTRMVHAAVRGWRRYVEDPEATHAYMRGKRDDLTEARLAAEHRALAPRVNNAEARMRGIGTMQAGRWEALHRVLADAGMIEAGDVEPGAAFEASFLPGTEDENLLFPGFGP